MAFLSLADEHACRKDEASADYDLKAGESEAGFEIAMTDEGDDYELHSYDGVGPSEGGVDVGNEKRERVEKTANERHEAGDQTAKHGIAPASEFAVVGEALGEGHRNAGAYCGRCTDEKDGTGIVRGECGGKDWGEGRNRAVHKASEARLHDPQDEALIVVENLGEFAQIWDVFGHLRNLI